MHSKTIAFGVQQYYNYSSLICEARFLCQIQIMPRIENKRIYIHNPKNPKNGKYCGCFIWCDVKHYHTPVVPTVIPAIFSVKPVIDYLTCNQ